MAGEKFSGAVFPDARSLNVSLSLFLFPFSLFSLLRLLLHPPHSLPFYTSNKIKNTMAATAEKPSGLGLYGKFAFAGAVCCSVTHGALTPVDVYAPHTKI